MDACWRFIKAEVNLIRRTQLIGVASIAWIGRVKESMKFSTAKLLDLFYIIIITQKWLFVCFIFSKSEQSWVWWKIYQRSGHEMLTQLSEWSNGKQLQHVRVNTRHDKIQTVKEKKKEIEIFLFVKRGMDNIQSRFNQRGTTCWCETSLAPTTR